MTEVKRLSPSLRTGGTQMSTRDEPSELAPGLFRALHGAVVQARWAVRYAGASTVRICVSSDIAEALTAYVELSPWNTKGVMRDLLWFGFPLDIDTGAPANFIAVRATTFIQVEDG